MDDLRRDDLLDGWRLRITSCTACALHQGRQNAVSHSGPSDAALMLIGEAPGASEDESGVPFCGRSGRLLDELLRRAGTSRDAVHIGNAVRCRPPQNRTPSASELATCRNFLHEELQIVQPRVIVTLGASAARAIGVLRATQPLGTIRGTLLRYDDVPLICTVHPAAVLRNRVRWEPALLEDLTAAVQVTQHGV